MPKNPVLMLTVSAALMASALVFGLYPETRSEAAVAQVSSPHARQLAILDYEGRAGSGSQGVDHVFVAVR